MLRQGAYIAEAVGMGVTREELQIALGLGSINAVNYRLKKLGLFELQKSGPKPRSV